MNTIELNPAGVNLHERRNISTWRVKISSLLKIFLIFVASAGMLAVLIGYIADLQRLTAYGALVLTATLAPLAVIATFNDFRRINKLG